MFSDFQNMMDKIKTGVNTVKSQVQHKEQDYANTPQKYQFSGREIQQIKLLSQGAFGFIWLAEDINTKQQFALKRVICMTQDRLNQSKLQKEVMSKLPKSDFIVKYYGGDIISRNGQKIVVTLMELCDGGTLFDLLQKRQNKGFNQQQLVNIVLSIAYGLSQIHSTGYYHRDVKIQNVLFGKDRKYKLCDFGSCTKQIHNFSTIHKKDYDIIKQQIQCMTTPMYRPPQIVDPYLKYTVNSKVDIWMIGCVLYTLSYFTHPFLDSNAIGIAAGTYRFPKYQEETKYKVSQKIKDLIRHLLTPNPNFRPSASQLINLLKNWEQFNQVPLNKQAQRRKIEQLQKQKQLQKLNKKCVDFDGDIPIQKLMQLQKRLKKVDQQQKPSSFINQKQTQKIKDLNSYNKYGVKINNIQQINSNISKNNIANANFVQFNQINLKNQSQTTKQVKKDINFNDLWGNQFSTNQNKKQQIKKQKIKITNPKSFDFFDAFGNNKKTNTIINSKNQQNNNKHSVNFQQLFTETPTNNNVINKSLNQQNKNNPKTNVNLLDF